MLHTVVLRVLFVAHSSGKRYMLHTVVLTTRVKLLYVAHSSTKGPICCTQQY
jgi:hypothetical protein